MNAGFFVVLRFWGDVGPVETFQIQVAWMVYALTAGLHALTLCVMAWLFR